MTQDAPPPQPAPGARHPRSGKAKIGKAVAWSAVELGFRYGAQLAIMIVLARLLQPADFGLVALLLVFVGVAAQLIEGSMGTALIRQPSVSADDLVTAFTVNLGTSVVLAAILVLLAPWMAAWFAQPLLAKLAWPFAAFLVASAAGTVPAALMSRNLQFRGQALATAIASTVSGVVAIWMALRGAGVWSLAAQSLIAAAVRSAMLWWQSGWRPTGRYRRDSLARLRGFGTSMLVSRLLDVGYLRMQSLLLGIWHGPTALGYFAQAQNTQQAANLLLGGVLNRVALPAFSALAADTPQLLRALRMSLAAATLVSFPAMVGIALVATPFVAVFLGPRWLPSAPILAILALAGSLWPLHALNLSALLAQGRSDLFLRAEIAKKTVAVTAILVAAPWGGVAMAWAILGASVFAAMVNCHYTGKLLGYGLGRQVADLWPIAALTAAMAAIVMAIGRIDAGQGVRLAAMVGAGVATYVGGAVVLKFRALDHVRSMFASMRQDTGRTDTFEDT